MTMVATAAQLEAARRYAPPLITVGQIDRRGARLRQVNRRAVEYVQHAGLALEDVYPGARGTIRALAPPMGSPEAPMFVRATGLPSADIYPGGALATFGGETSRARWRWGWATAGFIVGAVVVGPIGAVVGAVIAGAR
jgi:hypothetical protein